MTRWARGGPANKKKANEASSWQDLSSDVKVKKNTAPSHDKGGQASTASQKTAKKRKGPKQDPGVSPKKKSNVTSKSGPTFMSSSSQKVKSKRGFNPADLEDTSTDKCLFTKRFGHGFGLGTDELVQDTPKPTGLAAQLELLKKSTPLNEQEEQEISEVVKKDERREKRRLKRISERQMDKMCFNCRQQGHEIGNCPKLQKDNTQGTGICFKCGSTEHKINQCRLKVPEGHYPYAKCFLCGETGHLSKQCPDNPRGMYPKGGCCKICSSVEHYMKDCPDLQSQQGIESFSLTRMNYQASVDDEPSFHQPRKTAGKRTGPKVVKF